MAIACGIAQSVLLRRGPAASAVRSQSKQQTRSFKVKTVARNRDWLRAENDVNLAKTQRAVPVPLSRGAAQLGLNSVVRRKVGQAPNPSENHVVK